MRANFGKRSDTTARGVPKIGNILIPKIVYENDDPRVIVQHNVEFVNHLFSEGAYLRDEIPVNALRSFHADYYLAEVSNGGHGQFVANSGWQAVIVQDISDALEAMGAESY